MRPVPDRCLQLIHAFEGKAGQHEAWPTQDPTGHWEIGWGHRTTSSDYPGAPLSRDAADALARLDLLAAAAACDAALGPGTANGLTDGQWAAIICFTYNEGPEAFRTSTLCRLLRFGQYTAAAHEFDRWIFGHVDGRVVEFSGLRRRRAAEKTLFEA